MKILITGGAGFIGSNLTPKLHALGHEVTILDSLAEQIHGTGAVFSEHLTNAARCVKGSVIDREILKSCLRGQEIIIHLAAETGTGQSMYDIERYSQVNIQATSLLFDILVNQNLNRNSVRKIIVASSRAIYGEGQYLCKSHGVVYPGVRSEKNMLRRLFEPYCPICQDRIEVQPTNEESPLSPSSFYGLTKQVQEQIVLMFAHTLGIDAFALRFQNVYGPGQSLLNPYTGILSIFSNLIRQGKPISIFEDGLESRDFVFIDDVVKAAIGCIDENIHGIAALNVGSGKRVSVIEAAEAIKRYFGSNSSINITGEYRVGDIRHNFADLTRINLLTGFKPLTSFEVGLTKFLDWAINFNSVQGGYEQSMTELSRRGLLKITKS